MKFIFNPSSYADHMLRILLLSSLLATSTATIAAGPSGPAKFPTILVFGDSTVDTGNNNYIVTLFKGDHPPYGMDFPGRAATGRFSNGRLVPDMLASSFGIKEDVPPSLAPNLSDSDILTGVSFASAGSGFDDVTTLLSHVIPMSRQPGYFREYVRRVEGIVGREEASRMVGSALVLVSAGTNDFVLSYYDVPTRRGEFSIGAYQDFLQDKLRDFVKELYNLGCRKMVIAGLPPIGCLPMQMTAKSPVLRTCCHKENADARLYNDKLDKLLPQIEVELPGSKILYLDVYNPLIDLINNPQKYEFEETRRGCCGSGALEVGPLCNQLTPVCANPSRYIFWDSIHPSESTYRILSETIVELLSRSPQFGNE